jgi:prepilin-type N-terminal cleavage/methylation domain-containing protein
MKQWKGQKGFTLVEIAIVLVIIGLLLGGVLKGQQLIANAKLKSLVNHANGLSAAVFAYQDRYKALPGDDP